MLILYIEPENFQIIDKYTLEQSKSLYYIFLRNRGLFISTRISLRKKEDDGRRKKSSSLLLTGSNIVKDWQEVARYVFLLPSFPLFSSIHPSSSFYLYFYSSFSRGNAIVTRKARFDYFVDVIRSIGMRMFLFFLRFGLNSRYTRFFFFFFFLHSWTFLFFLEFRFVFSIETQFFSSFFSVAFYVLVSVPKISNDFPPISSFVALINLEFDCSAIVSLKLFVRQIKGVFLLK